MPSDSTAAASETAAGAARRHVVCRADELAAGGRKMVRIGSREVGVFNVDGTFYGLRNLCPHRSGPLCLGRLRPLVVWDDGQIAHTRENEILKCPWHQYEFDVKTGICVADPKMRVRSYRVERQGDEIVLYD